MFLFLSPAIYFQGGRGATHPPCVSGEPSGGLTQPHTLAPADSSVLDPLAYLEHPTRPGLPNVIRPPTSPKS